MGTSTTYVDLAYRILCGDHPPPTLDARARRIAVMREWDGRKFDGDITREHAARMALCQIGLAWHPTDRYPYALDEVTERLRECMPELGAQEVTGRTMLDILQGKHPSQYPGWAKAKK